MGVMQTLTASGTAEFSEPVREEEVSVPAGIDAAMVDAIDRVRAPLRHWPKAIANLYHKEVVRRLYREQHFLFLLGLLICLGSIIVDILVNPQMAGIGAVLRVLAVAPLVMIGMIAGARGWTSLVAFFVGASPIAFIAVLLHLSAQMPPDLAPRYVTATFLVVGLANIILPYSLRGLIVFDCAALLVTTAMFATRGLDVLAYNFDSLLVFALVAGATLPVAGRFEKLRQENFLLTLRARIAGRELLKANRALHTLSETDPLTGIANRRCFERQFDTAILAPGKDGRGADRIALMMIDLDHFKAFNDSHGHQAGDYCLSLVAEALDALFKDTSGIVARYGGEEFVGAVRARDATIVNNLAEEVRQTIASVLTPVDETDRPMVTASIGVGIAPASAQLPREELIEMADAALYAAKEQGRNRVDMVEAEPAFGNAATGR